MNREQVDAVLGHEITHVANGDMVTMALIQGVLNTFVIFLARVLGSADRPRDQRQPRQWRRRHSRYFVIVMRAADRARLSRLADRHGVLALARVPRRRRRRASGRTRLDDLGAAAPRRQPRPVDAAEGDPGVRDYGRGRHCALVRAAIRRFRSASRRCARKLRNGRAALGTLPPSHRCFSPSPACGRGLG